MSNSEASVDAVGTVDNFNQVQLSNTQLSDSIVTLVERAKQRYQACFGGDDETTTQSSPSAARNAHIVAAPGRVNLIGEHTDYTGGFVLPLAIDYCTVIYGVGTMEDCEDDQPSAMLRFTSCNRDDSATQAALTVVSIDSQSAPPTSVEWTTYVVGTVFQYLADLQAIGGDQKGKRLKLRFAIAGDVPLGSGLSSSASLEVATARFVECILGDRAFGAERTADDFIAAKTRALRCQKAENEWCNSPCGIMDQYVSSAANAGTLLCIDCRSLQYQPTKMASTSDPPVLVVTNSNVQHDIAGGEYPVRVAQCQTATKALSQINAKIESLRDATLQDVDAAKDRMDAVSYNRAKHVVTENQRTVDAKAALEAGDWDRVGNLMNQSHASMKDDYEVSCEEIDVLVDLAQAFEGVYGSRLTGGGFGGCTVTLVRKDRADALMQHLRLEYKAKTEKDCVCFVTSPAVGVRVLGTDRL